MISLFLVYVLLHHDVIGYAIGEILQIFLFGV